MIRPRGAKKPRGWKRRLRELDRWAAAYAALDERDLLAADYHSAEIWFGRWPSPLPLGVARQVVRRLVEIHDRWLPGLLRYADPFYLGIWLYEPGLEGSQVCAAAGPAAASYGERHDAAERAAPPPVYHRRPYDLARFEWTRHTFVERERLSNFDEEDWPSLVRDARAVERTDDDIIVTLEHDGWFGRLPPPR